MVDYVGERIFVWSIRGLIFLLGICARVFMLLGRVFCGLDRILNGRRVKDEN